MNDINLLPSNSFSLAEEQKLNNQVKLYFNIIITCIVAYLWNYKLYKYIYTTFIVNVTTRCHREKEARNFFLIEKHNQIRSDQLLSPVRLLATPWIAARQASLSLTNSQSSLRLTSIESVMPSSHLILCRPFLLLPPIPPSIRVFSNESTIAPL